LGCLIRLYGVVARTATILPTCQAFHKPHLQASEMGKILLTSRHFSNADYPLYTPNSQGIPAIKRSSYTDDDSSSTESQGQVYIRILQLQPLEPLPWCLKWLPVFLRNHFVPLRGSLDIIRLGQENQPQHNALSYTWGPPVFSDRIMIDGRELAITFSLAEALRHLRPEKAPLPIWIDQICINQMDDDEKSKQVEVMDKIYRSAEEGLVWLGPQADGSDHLMVILLRMVAFATEFGLPDYYTRTRISELIRICAKDDPNDPATVKYHIFCEEITPFFTREIFKSLTALQKRAWFQRLWVLQEYALAKEVTFICGGRRIRAEILMSVLSMIGRTISDRLILASPQAPDRKLALLIEEMNGLNTMAPFTTSRQRRKASDRKEIDDHQYGGDSLYQILQRAYVNNDNSLQATVACDKVYGLLGLACDKEELKELGLCPNYAPAGKPPDVVFTKTARALIQSKRVETLLFAQHYKGDTNQHLTAVQKRPKQTQNLQRPLSWLQNFLFENMKKTKDMDAEIPSWVPDWRQKIQRSFALLRDETSDPLFSASKGMAFDSQTETTRDVPTVEDKRSMTLKGYCVDEIEQVSQVWEGAQRDWNSRSPFPSQVYIDYLEQVRQMCQLAKHKDISIHSSEQRMIEAEWRIPVGDIEQDASAKASRAKPAWREAYNKCLAELRLQKELAMMSSVEAAKARVDAVFSMSGDSSGYGVRMQELKGKRPFLSHLGYVGMGPAYMRPGDVIVVLGGASLPFIVRPAVDGNFRLMGECYCDGIMDGELVAARKSANKIEESVTLILWRIEHKRNDSRRHFVLLVELMGVIQAEDNATQSPEW